jgi:hypothetical protein
MEFKKKLNWPILHTNKKKIGRKSVSGHEHSSVVQWLLGLPMDPKFWGFESGRG